MHPINRISYLGENKYTISKIIKFIIYLKSNFFLKVVLFAYGNWGICYNWHTKTATYQFWYIALTQDRNHTPHTSILSFKSSLWLYVVIV